MLYQLYNADQPVAAFSYDQGAISEFEVIQEHLLPMQLRRASADGFTQ